MKRNKKGAVLAAALLMTAAFPAAAYAAEGSSTVTAVPDEATKIEVQAKYEDATETDTVYKVDVNWGAMEFIYHESGSNVWNPDTHQYELAASGQWTSTGDTVTVTNHSNEAVTANLEFAPAAAYTDLTGTFDITQLSLESAVGTTVAEAPSRTAKLTLSGSLPAGQTEFGTVGQITVKLQ